MAMKQLFDSHWESLFDIALRKTGDEEVAKDITQELFISIWENRHKIEIEVSLMAYMHGALKHKIINYYRSKSAKESQCAKLVLLIEKVYSIESDEQLIFKEAEQRVTAALDKLPQRMRTIVAMSRLQNKSIREIAKELNLSSQTIKNQITAAMKILRQSLHI